MPESPAEYVARIEAELRAMKSAATSAAQTAERALTRLKEWEPIVDAAVEFYKYSDAIDPAAIGLIRATEAEIKRRESES